jgi:hypothetical protein
LNANFWANNKGYHSFFLIIQNFSQWDAACAIALGGISHFVWHCAVAAMYALTFFAYAARAKGISSLWNPFLTLPTQSAFFYDFFC